MTVTIYQFCRGFDNVRYSDIYKCYVSGGYSFNPIARSNQTIPPPITEAVVNGAFKLNDNYPPEKDDFALIAREIDDKYSVLAVANRQLDDGGRPTIGYKYFWLEKSSLNVDGIGTLIHWWSEKQPKFEMAELLETSPSEIFYYDQEQPQRSFPFQEHWLSEISDIVGKLKFIPHLIVVKKEKWQGLPSYMQLHYWALGLSQRTNYFNAWAWNVKRIQSPTSFLAIFYSSHEDIPHISKLPLTTKPNNSESNLDSNTELTEDRENIASRPKNLGQTAPIQKIRNCLTDIATMFNNQHRLDHKKTQDLFRYLTEYPDINWADCINEKILKNSAIDDIYPQLIYMVAPEYPASQEWLVKMVNSVAIESKKKSQLNQIFDECREKARSVLGISDNTNQESNNNIQWALLNDSQENPEVNKKLQNSIFLGIKFLLEYLMNTNKKIAPQKIEYFLTQSPTIWPYQFQKYAEVFESIMLNEIHKMLIEDSENQSSEIKKPEIENDDNETVLAFCKPILDIIKTIKDNPSENKTYGKYQNLADVFHKIDKIGQMQAAALLYLISGTKVPKDIRNNLSLDIREKIFHQTCKANNVKGKTGLPPNNSESQNNNEQGDPLNNSIFGFLFFCVSSALFFNSIEEWTGWPMILIPCLALFIGTFAAVYFTGNPLKIRNNFSIYKWISFIYIALAPAFLIIGLHQQKILTFFQSITTIFKR